MLQLETVARPLRKALITATAAVMVAVASQAAAAELPSINDVGTNLGVQVRRAMMMRSDLGKDAQGNDVLFMVTMGNPSQLVVLDVNTGKVVNVKPLTGTSGAWGVKVSPDGTVYLGAYNSGFLYRYNPATDELTNLGHPFPATKDTVLYPMDMMPDGKVYGGSYPSGHAYEFDPATGKFRDLGDMTSTTEKERWIRVTVVDQENQKLYMGVGNRPELIEYDLKTSTSRNILPKEYSNITSVYDLNVIEGKLIARKETSNPNEYFVLEIATGKTLPVTDADTGETSTVFTNASRGMTALSPIARKMYFVPPGENLHEFDVETLTIKDLNVDLAGVITGSAYTQLKDPEFPGWSLVGTVGNAGKLFWYNLQTGKSKVEQPDYPAEPINIHEIITGPDGKIYTGGYLAGNMGVYDPESGKTTHLMGSGQPEGYTFVGRNLFMGIYPTARIYQFNIDAPWQPGDKDQPNPKRIFSMESRKDIPRYASQDRPWALVGSEDEKTLFVGTTPKNGLLGGALAVYDIASGNEPDVYWNIIEDQSIVSLTFKDGLLYGGTCIWGGMGIEPTRKNAELFIWDPAKNEVVFHTAPVPGKAAITTLHVGPDGHLWGFAGGVFFVFDREKREVIYQNEEFAGSGGRYREARLITGVDGQVYGSAFGTFFRVGADYKLERLAKNVGPIAQDHQGRFYTYRHPITEMWQFTLEGLKIKE